jgi:hypothetical protein
VFAKVSESVGQAISGLAKIKKNSALEVSELNKKVCRLAMCGLRKILMVPTSSFGERSIPFLFVYMQIIPMCLYA